MTELLDWFGPYVAPSQGGGPNAWYSAWEAAADSIRGQPPDMGKDAEELDLDELETEMEEYAETQGFESVEEMFAAAAAGEVSFETFALVFSAMAAVGVLTITGIATGFFDEMYDYLSSNQVDGHDKQVDSDIQQSYPEVPYFMSAENPPDRPPWTPQPFYGGYPELEPLESATGGGRPVTEPIHLPDPPNPANEGESSGGAFWALPQTAQKYLQVIEDMVRVKRETEHFGPHAGDFGKQGGKRKKGAKAFNVSIDMSTRGKTPKQGRPPGTRMHANQAASGGGGGGGGSATDSVLERFAAPSNVGTRRIFGAPKLHNGSRDREIIVTHSEEVTDLSSTGTTYNIQSFPMNPGQNQVFGWLSRFAQMYQCYEFVRVEAEFDPAEGSTTAGTINMSFNMDPVDAAPTSRRQQTQLPGSEQASAWVPLRCQMPTKDIKRIDGNRYIRQGVQPANTDLKTYDSGNLLVSFSNVASGAVVGTLYMHYTVKFFSPYDDLIAFGNTNSAFLLATSTGTTSTQLPFSVAPTITGSLPVTAAVSVANATTITFGREGTFLCVWLKLGTSMITTTAPTLTGTAASVLYVGEAVDTTATHVVSFFTVTVTAPNQTVIITEAAGQSGTITQSRLRVALYGSEG